MSGLSGDFGLRKRTLSARGQDPIQSPGGLPPRTSSSWGLENSKSPQQYVSRLSAVEPTTTLINPNKETIMVIEDIKQVKQLLSKLDDAIDKKPDYVSIEIKEIKEELEQSFIKKMLDIFSQKVDKIKFTRNPQLNENNSPPSPNKMRLEQIKTDIKKVVNAFFKEEYLRANKLNKDQTTFFCNIYYELEKITQDIERCFPIKFERPSWILLT